MSTAELKIDIISRIANVNEPHIIEEISKFIDFEINTNTYQLSPQQIQRVSEAKNEYATGKFLTEEQANAEVDKWLNDK